MDVRTLCLGVLSMGDATGYEIKKTLEDSFRPFYDASFGSIYPALGRLQDAGHVTCVEMAQEGRPDKKVYSLTPAGRQSLMAELAEPPAPDRIRSEFLVAMVFAEFMQSADVGELIERRIAALRETLAKLEAKELDDLSPGRRFVIGYGISFYRAGLAYLEANRGLVEGAARPGAEVAD
ncbi:MAG: PadR family transcriptional regulator [Alphaproteobacteria bacterium]|nr:PadR family transcriptional regulator [Alphaproteobacteria bacterium]